MTIPQETRMTEAEYDTWCWTVEDRTEFAGGRVIFLSPEAGIDENLRWLLGDVLRAVAEVRGGAAHGPNLQIRLPGGSRRVPDLLFVSRDRLADLHDTYFEGGPDLAIEIVSRDSSKRDRLDKFAEYERAGVREYWIIDPIRRTVDAHRLGSSGKYQVIAAAGVWLQSRVAPEFRICTEWLWKSPLPSTREVLRELGLSRDRELEEKLKQAEARAARDLAAREQAEISLAEEATRRRALEAKILQMTEELRRQGLR